MTINPLTVTIGYLQGSSSHQLYPILQSPFTHTRQPKSSLKAKKLVKTELSKNLNAILRSLVIPENRQQFVINKLAIFSNLSPLNSDM
jgi:hypothetical protein